ncbi:hypothetical protein [Gracilinema caldarium]|uniref:hypothetical protein n=1 Tax=Gracilinema caldarium TaxID=215591 RepID=UPI0026EEAC78|nr:hypothetical protein [Gracilinema caldarium]
MAVLQRCLYVLPILFLVLGCSKKNIETRETKSVRPEPFRLFTYKQGQDSQDSNQGQWYEISPGHLNPIKDPANSQVVPYAPWTAARRIVGFVARSSNAFAGLNREGFLVFEETPAGDLALYKIDGGAFVEPYCALALMLVPSAELGTAQNLGQSLSAGSVPALLVARDPYFGDLLNGSGTTAGSGVSSPSVPENPFVYLDWADFSPQAKLPQAIRPQAVRPAAFGIGLANVEALTRSSDGRWYMKVAQSNATARAATADSVSPGTASASLVSPAAASAGSESSKFYYAAPALNKEATRISRGDYQNALYPQPFGNMPRAVQTLMRAFSDSQRKKHYPVLQLLKKDSYGLETFVADPETKNTVPLSGGETEIVKFLGYADSEKALVILPDGRGVIRRSKIEAFELPSLPEGFAYTGVVLINRWLIASWEEQESFAVGAAGFLVLPL